MLDLSIKHHNKKSIDILSISTTHDVVEMKKLNCLTRCEEPHSVSGSARLYVASNMLL